MTCFSKGNVKRTDKQATSLQKEKSQPTPCKTQTLLFAELSAWSYAETLCHPSTQVLVLKLRHTPVTIALTRLKPEQSIQEMQKPVCIIYTLF